MVNDGTAPSLNHPTAGVDSASPETSNTPGSPGRQKATTTIAILTAQLADV